jgi:hypothetical protein
MKIEVIRSSKTLVITSQTTPPHNSEDNNSHFYRRENSKFQLTAVWNTPEHSYNGVDAFSSGLSSFNSLALDRGLCD